MAMLPRTSVICFQEENLSSKHLAHKRNRTHGVQQVFNLVFNSQSHYGQDWFPKSLKGLPVRTASSCSFRTCSAQQQENRSAVDTYETLKLERVREKVLHVELNRPEKRNAMNSAFWREMVECFNKISQDQECHAVVLSGAGKLFTAGIDLMEMGSVFMMMEGGETGRKAWNTHKKIREYQETFTVLEKCPKPVIVAVHGACLGAGMSLITACDIRYCTQDAWFQIKEVDIGLAADVGALQRWPRIVGNQRSVGALLGFGFVPFLAPAEREKPSLCPPPVMQGCLPACTRGASIGEKSVGGRHGASPKGLVNELCFTARKMMAPEAQSSGLVSRVFQDKEAMMQSAFDLATEIASKSPVAVQGTKVNLIYSRDHSVPEGLKYMASWNMSMLQSEDILKSVQAAIEKKTPKDVVYAKL